ncbi:hypothetical protein [Streptomyces xanthochromogenes]
MTTISLTDLADLVEMGNPHHHPHLLKVTKNEFNRISFEFKTFIGTEEEPERPNVIWSYDLPEPVSKILSAEYDTAHALWIDAKYIRTLKAVAAQHNAPAKWDAYTRARAAMNDAFNALNTTADNQWNAAVSRLVAAQETALETAKAWDGTARQIAEVHYDHSSSYLPWSAAHEQAGLSAKDWDVQDRDAYTDTYNTHTPLVGKVQDAINEQRNHLRTVASLTSPTRT